jgi:hypothetical protein
MIDSRDKRASILGFALAALAILPAPAGDAVDVGNRAQLAYGYSGNIAAPTPPEPPAPPTDQVFGIVDRRPIRPRLLIVGDGAVTAKRPVFQATVTIRSLVTLAVRSGPKSKPLFDAVGSIERPRVEATAAVTPTTLSSLHSAGGLYRSVSRRSWTPQAVRGHALVGASGRSMSALAEIARPMLIGSASVTAEPAAVTGQGDDE